MYPKSRYAAEGVCFECHVIAWQYALHERVELSAGFDSWSRALAGADHGAHGGGDRCVFGIERMYCDKTRRSAVCGRSLHCQFLFELECGYPKSVFEGCPEIHEHTQLPQNNGNRKVTV